MDVEHFHTDLLAGKDHDRALGPKTVGNTDIVLRKAMAVPSA